MNNLLFLFLISGLLRYAVTFLMPTIKEVRKVKKPKSSPVYYLKEVNPARAIYEFFQGSDIAQKKN